MRSCFDWLASRSLELVATSFVAAGLALSPGPAHSQSASDGYLFSLSDVGQSFGKTLLDHGVYINAGYIGNFSPVVSGGANTGIAYSGEAFFGTDLDLQKIIGDPHAFIHFQMDDRHGSNPSRLAGMEFYLDANHGSLFQLSELSYDQSFFNDHVRLLIGRIDPTADFFTSALACQFVSAQTCAQTWAWYVNNNAPVYPYSAWGARITLKPTLTTYLRAGLYQDQYAPNLPGAAHGFDWGTDKTTGVFAPVEVGYETNYTNDAFPRKYLIGWWYDSSPYSVPLSPGPGQGEGRSAVYAMLQQTVYRPDPRSPRGLTVFAQALLATSGYQTYPDYINAGFFQRGTFAGRPNDSIGFDASWAKVNGRLQQAIAQQIVASGRTGDVAPDEFIFELEYGIGVAPGVELKPYAQYVIHPDQIGFTPRPDIHNAVVVGAQFSVFAPTLLGMPHLLRSD